MGILRPKRGVRLFIAAAAAAALAAALTTQPASAASITNDPGVDKQHFLPQVGAPAAWNRSKGAGVTIAVVDSGADLSHPDLVPKLVGGTSFTGSPTAQDDCGHGTHVSGIAAAATGNGVGVAGVAPDAKVMPVKVLSDDGQGNCSGNTDGVGQGIRWAVDRGAEVINLSLGGDIQFLTGSGIEDDLEYAWSKGAIPIVAAGNQYLLGSGYSNVHAIIVTSVGPNDAKSSFSSSTGSAMWAISAPGGGETLDSEIFSTYWVAGKSAQYGYLAGTSMATPVVSGTAALLVSMGITPQQTVDCLLSTSRDLGRSGRDSTYGSGRVDAAAATTCAANLRPKSTTVTTAPPLGTVTSAGGTRTTGGGGTSGTAAPGRTGSTSSGSSATSPVRSGGGSATTDVDASGEATTATSDAIADGLAAPPDEAAAGVPDTTLVNAGDDDSRPWLPAAIGLGALASVGGLAAAATRRSRRAS